MPRPHRFLVTNHSGFPCHPFSPDDSEARREAIRVSVQSQAEAGLDIVSIGHGGQRDPVVPFVQGLEGLALSDETLELSTHEEVRVPVAEKPLRQTGSLFEEDLATAQSVTHLPVKISFPGPYTLSRVIADPKDLYDSIGGFIEALSAILADEIRTLAGRGAAIIQLEEPHLLLCPSDFPRLQEGILPLHEAKGMSQLALVLSGGPITPLYDWLQNLPIDVLSLDLTQSPGLVDVISDRQTSLILGLGLVDGHGEEEPTEEALAQTLSRVARGVMGSTVHIHPSSDLSDLSPDVAKANLERLVALVREFTPPAASSPTPA
jgi:5-methyltetrahydropteroyltriglutamate--homocysteine methyltransferase